LLPLANRPDSVLLAVPAEAVSAMRGKKAARAAPMSALLARSACSAASTSGRCCSTLEGRPAEAPAAAKHRGFGACSLSRVVGSTFGRRRGAHQQRERVAVLLHQAVERGGIRARGIDRALRLRERQARLRTQRMAALDQVVGLALALQRAARERQALLVRGQLQPGGGHGSHQADLRAALRFLGLEVALQRRFAQVAHAAEQVELVGRHAQVGAVLRGDARLAAGRQAARRARAAAARAGFDAWEQARARDAVLGPCALDVERRHAQVAVIGEREFDHAPQPACRRRIAPADVERRGRGDAARRQGLRHRRGRRFILPVRG
jgi:hypothetical protein